MKNVAYQIITIGAPQNPHHILRVTENDGGKVIAVHSSKSLPYINRKMAELTDLYRRTVAKI